MKTTAAAIIASAAVASAQLHLDNSTGQWVCGPKSGAFCVGDSLQTDILVTCPEGVEGMQPFNRVRCEDRLAGSPGYVAWCYQSAADAGDAQCIKNCEVGVGNDGTSKLPASVCTPDGSLTTATSSSVSTAEATTSEVVTTEVTATAETTTEAVTEVTTTHIATTATTEVPHKNSTVTVITDKSFTSTDIPQTTTADSHQTTTAEGHQTTTAEGHQTTSADDSESTSANLSLPPHGVTITSTITKGGASGDGNGVTKTPSGPSTTESAPTGAAPVNSVGGAIAAIGLAIAYVL